MMEHPIHDYNIKPPTFALELSPTTATESNFTNTPPFSRDSSPSPSISPTPALFACPPLERSFSAATSSDYSSSSTSSISQPSLTSRSSSASAALRQRGYVRPQGVSFAPSAGNRDSVMSLGSIAHLQYYFARTGLLDGKGGQLAKDDKGKPGAARPSRGSTPRIYDPPNLGLNNDNDPPNDPHSDNIACDGDEPLMLPPTVSTYSHRVQYIPPPPDSETLRQDLMNALYDAKKALEQVDEQSNEAIAEVSMQSNAASDSHNQNTNSSFSQSSGWYGIQGMHILDVVTLAIRAAKIYYTSHEDPNRLYSIKSERRIREELLGVLDVLKRMVGRNFAGGMRHDELQIIRNWVNGIKTFIADEQALAKQEAEERESWQWLEGPWTGKERQREWSFLNSFNAGDTLPEWTISDPSDQQPTPFLEVLRSGLTLVHLHNILLKKTKRQFGEIKTFHTDTAKPYRCAENLRYWIKAAEIRWETTLKIDVSGVVNGKAGAFADFDAGILQWSQAIRNELTKEWKEVASRSPLPR